MTDYGQAMLDAADEAERFDDDDHEIIDDDLDEDDEDDDGQGDE